MILIGEKLNSSIPKTLAAFEARDEAAVVALIEQQAAAGAEFLDVNAAICGDSECEVLLWAIGLVRAHSSCGVMIDTTAPDVMTRALESVGDCAVILNSTTIDERFDTVVPLALKSGAGLVALPIDSEGMPHTLEEKTQKIDCLIAKLRTAGVPDDKIYLDVLIETLATDGMSARNALGAVAHVCATYPQVKTTCGLSNISFGLPRRALINSAFVTAAVMAGLSSAIADPASPALRDALAAARVVAGEDDYCMEYITHIRSADEQ